MLSLSNLIRLMIVGGLIAVGLVAVKACQRPATGVERFAVGSLSKLTTLDAPPARPDLALETGEETVRLSDYAGRVTLVNVWATWCAPCVAEMPSLDRLAAAREGADFAVVPISLDRTVPEIETFYERYAITNLPVRHDPNYVSQQRLQLPGLPTTILYDRAGREVARLAGEAEWDSPEALALVDYLIDGR